MMTLILAIETSCDETAAAVIEDGHIIRSNVVASQIEIHRAYGGVFPEIASRQHVFDIVPVIEAALEGSGATWGDLQAIAVTRGPGLAGSLLVGVEHREGGRMGARACRSSPSTTSRGTSTRTGWTKAARSSRRRSCGPACAELDAGLAAFPLLVLVVSGGHTELIVMRGHGRYERLGATLDDAAGEAFDKVATADRPGLSWRPCGAGRGGRRRPAALRLPPRTDELCHPAPAPVQFQLQRPEDRSPTAGARAERSGGRHGFARRRPGGKLPGRRRRRADFEDRARGRRARRSRGFASAAEWRRTRRCARPRRPGCPCLRRSRRSSCARTMRL